MSKSNVESKLEQRETRRKQSVVKALIGNEREELKSIEPQRGRPSDPTKEKKKEKALHFCLVFMKMLLRLLTLIEQVLAK